MNIKPTIGIILLSLVITNAGIAQDEIRPKEDAAGNVGENVTKVDPAKTKADTSYGMGYSTGIEFGQRYGSYGITLSDLEMETFLKGFIRGFNGDTPEVDEAAIGAAMQAFGDLIEKREVKLAEANLEKGNAYLAENKKKDGITTLESGLQYEILSEGGEEVYAEPKEGEAAKEFLVNYKGSLVDGTQFDASPEGEPVPMTLTDVFPGLSEALKKIPVGAKWRLYVPSELAFGEQRIGSQIEPNSVIIFDLELVKIQDAPKHPGGFDFPLPEGLQGE